MLFIKSSKLKPLFIDSQFVQPVAQGTKTNIQQLGSLVLASVAAVEGFFQIIAFNFLQNGIQGNTPANFIQVKTPAFKTLYPATFVHRERQAVG